MGTKCQGLNITANFGVNVPFVIRSVELDDFVAATSQTFNLLNSLFRLNWDCIKIFAFEKAQPHTHAAAQSTLLQNWKQNLKVKGQIFSCFATRTQVTGIQ